MHGGAMFLLTIIVVTYASSAVKADERRQFYGGSLSYKVHEKPDGKNMLAIELITGWVIGKGPCGFNCTKADIGRSTKSSRQTVLRAHDPSWLGTFHLEHLVNGTTTSVEYLDTVMSNYTEKVLALSMTAGWEQVILKSSFDMLNESDYFDINYDGISWKPLPLQSGTTDPDHLYWHFQITVSNKLRNDTGKHNNCPHSIARPFYRIKLDQVTPIRIPAVDADGDIIKCQIAQYVEGGAIATHPPPYVNITENCIVYVNASAANGYVNDTWIGVPVSVRDYNRETIIYGTEEFKPAMFSLSSTTVQFLVQVLANLSTPVFVEPTLEGNHNFIMYADTTWRTEIYAEAVMNTTIDEFSTIVIDNENVTLSAPQEEGSSRPQVKFATMSWKPLASDVGRHILCAQATDNTGVDTAEMRCFTLDVLADKFNHSTIATPGKPYFVDIPSPDQFVNCKLQATCVVPLFVYGDVEVTEVRIESSRLDESKLGPIELVNHNGVQLYKTDLSFSHSMHGKESICFQATDKNGVSSDVVCVKSRIEPPDPCESAPCKNGGTCRKDEDTGGYVCICFDKFSGKTCEKKDDPCKPDPCVPGQAMMCVNMHDILCYCKPGWEGDHCEKSEDDCAKKHVTCSGHGTCTDKHRDYECNCFSRYSGKNCEHDNCSTDYIDEFTCPSNGCSPNPCQNDGICSDGGVCSCSNGYSDSHCSTAKCSLPGTVTSVDIIPPTMLDKSQWTCYVDGSTVEPCKLRIYMTTQSGSKPNLLIDTTESLNSIISTGPVEISSDIPGTSNVFSADILINGIVKTAEDNYICVTANEGTMNSSRCFGMNFVQNPYKDTQSNRYPQKDAAVKFIEPTLKDHDRIVCKTSERCSVLLYTSFVSTRLSCQPKTGGVAISSVSAGCDRYDQDNDADDAAKAADPCCSQVVSSTSTVNVYKAHPRGPSCISEASFTFTSPGEKEICFQSAKNKTISQQICYTVDVYDPNTDPCSSSPCLNNGHCLYDGHTKFRCICPENYIGKRCEQGPCQPANNNCQNDAYCQTDSGTNTCICKAGYSGPQCAQDHSSLSTADSLKFTDTATPKTFTCVRIQMCSFALILSGKPGSVPHVSAGYVSPSILLEGIDTTERPSVPGSFQANILLKAKELGMQDLCIQSRDSKGVNKDEVCVKVNVISDVVTIYSFKDRPHFVDPSLPTDSKLECQAQEACHVLYHATVGVGNEHECLVVSPKHPTGFTTARLFTSCETCTPGALNNVNCSVDVSIVNAHADIGKSRHICLSLSLKGVNTTGEERCFDLKVTDPAAPGTPGCQRLECQNGGFCDGHIPDSPVCYCPSGFSGQNCATGIKGSHTQTFIGDLSFPSEIKCVLGQECTIPFQLTTTGGITPVVSLGFASPPLSVEKLVLENKAGSSTMFQGFAQANPTKIGTFKVCLQANDANQIQIEAEMCVDVDVIDKSIRIVDKNQPYFVAPTTPDDSTILCQINKACHLDMHFTKGDAFSFNGVCPSLTDTSTVPLQGIHIFDAVSHSSDCSSDIYYLTNSTGSPSLCVQVSLPGKRGEIRCYSLKIVPDINNEVESPCFGKTCQNGGKCLADLSTSPAKTSCVCAAGYIGIDCSSAVNKSSIMPGVENLNGTQTGTPKFNDKSAIPSEVKCFVNEPCCLDIPFYGSSDKPPVDGFLSPDLALLSKEVLTPESSKPDFHLFQTCYKANSTGTQRRCLQTTVDGSENSTNIDEICTAIHTESGGSHSGVSRFNNTIPDGSTVTCPTNTVCHKTIITNKNSSGSCSPVKECGDGVKGVHVFETQEKDGRCFTDVAIKTEGSSSSNLCVSAGKGDEERHFQLDIRDRTDYGPCQKLHCINGGRCMANTLLNATCQCIPGYTGTLCEINIDDCSPQPCVHGTCTDMVNDYSCSCVAGYTGKNCSEAMTTTASTTIPTSSTTETTTETSTTQTTTTTTVTTTPTTTSSTTKTTPTSPVTTAPTKSTSTTQPTTTTPVTAATSTATSKSTLQAHVTESSTTPKPTTTTMTTTASTTIPTSSTTETTTETSTTQTTKTTTVTTTPTTTSSTTQTTPTSPVTTAPTESTSTTQPTTTTPVTAAPTTSTATSKSTLQAHVTESSTTPKPTTTTITTTTSTATTPATTETTKKTSTTPTMTTKAVTTASITAATTQTTSTTRVTAAPTTSTATLKSTTQTQITESTTTKASTPKPTTSLCQCHHGTCVNLRCVCKEGWSGELCNNVGGSRTHPGIKTDTDTSPPAFTELVIPKIIPCKVDTFCSIILPAIGKSDKSPFVEHGHIDNGLEDRIKVQPKDANGCSSGQLQCPYEAIISVKPSAAILYKYCVLTKDYQHVNVDELCYQIQGVPGETNSNATTGFVYPPTLPDNSTMECPSNLSCHFQLEVLKKNGECDKNLTVDPPGASVVFLSSENKTSTCKYEVAYTPANHEKGQRQLCFTPKAHYSQQHCMIVDVTEKLHFEEPVHCQQEDKIALEHAKEMVITGYASCFCMVNNKKVHVIKKRPVVPKEKLIKAAGFGAGGMAGTMVVGVVVYAVVSKMRQPPEKKKPTPRPKSRVHPNNP